MAIRRNQELQRRERERKQAILERRERALKQKREAEAELEEQKHQNAIKAFADAKQKRELVVAARQRQAAVHSALLKQRLQDTKEKNAAA